MSKENSKNRLISTKNMSLDVFRNSSPELSVPTVQITEVFVKKVNENCKRPNMNTAEDLRSPAERERMSSTFPLNQKLSLLTCVETRPMVVRSFNLIGL